MFVYNQQTPDWGLTLSFLFARPFSNGDSEFIGLVPYFLKAVTQ